MKSIVFGRQFRAELNGNVIYHDFSSFEGYNRLVEMVENILRFALI